MSGVKTILTKEIGYYTLADVEALHLMVEQGARVVINEPAYFSGLIRTINLELQEGAYVEWQGFLNASSLHETVTVTLARYATFLRTFHGEQFGALTASYTYVLEGVEARATLVGRLSLSGNAVNTWTIRQLHEAPSTYSFVDLKTVLTDQVIFSYDGTITIERNAAYSQAFQSQKNLVVSPDVQVRSVPNLEALTHEVQCGHGSAVAHVNDDHLFYFQSRGFTNQKAQALLIEAFLNA